MQTNLYADDLQKCIVIYQSSELADLQAIVNQ